MDLATYIENVHAQLEATAQAGDEGAREIARRLVAPLDAAIRLAIQDALTAAADEITVELAPGSVELRLRGRELGFVVISPPVSESADTHDDGPDDDGAAFRAMLPADTDDAVIARINVRMPEHLKARVEQAAEREGLSVNAWLVRAAAGRVERSDAPRRRDRRAPHGPERYTGWAR